MSNVTQDREVDALYITCRAHDRVHHTKTVCEEPMVNLDYDAEGNVLGVEILDLQAEIAQRWVGPVEVRRPMWLPTYATGPNPGYLPD